MIGRRLDKLSQRCNDMLTTASIIGRVFTLDQIHSVVEDTSEGQLLDVIDEALAVRAIEEMPGTIGEYQFTHALIQETLSGELSTTRRVRLHAAIAVVLESLWGDKADDNATQLTEHFAEAETVLGSEKLVHYLEIAGNQALDAYGYEEAQLAFKRALRALDGEENTLQVANLWHGLGTAQAFTLGRQEMQTTVDSLIKAFDAFVEMGQIQKAIQVGLPPLPNVHGPEGMVQLIERAIELVPTGTVDHARLLAEYVTCVSMKSLDHSRVEESVNEALRIATGLEDHALELRICAISILPISAVLGVERGLELGHCAVELSAIADVPGAEVIAGETVGASMVAWGDMAGGMLQGDASVKAAIRSRSVFHLIAAYTERANRAILLGDWDSALADIKAVAMRDPDELRVLLTYYKLDANTADHERIMERLARLWERARTDDAISMVRSMGWRAAAEYSYMLGRDIGPPDVEKIAEEDRHSVDSATLSISYLSLPLVESHVFIDIVRGESGRMEESYRLLKEGIFPISVTEYRTRRLNRSRIKALAYTAFGEYDRTESEFEASIQEDSQIGAVPDMAWARYEYADMLLKRAAPGDQEKANQLQDEAIAVARKLGMNLLLERVLSQREILKAYGAA